MTLEKILETQLNIIPSKDGSVMHALKFSDKGYFGFEEIYFSTVKKDSIKAWKRHKQMILNLVVPVGSIRFVFAFNNKETNSYDFRQFILNKENYLRLTVPTNIWFGFQGLDDGLNLAANIANMAHDPNEIERMDLNSIKYDWNNI